MEGLHDAADRARLREVLLAPLPTAVAQAPAARESRAAEVARFALLGDPRSRGDVVLVG